ncbi:MAG: methyltransferase [Gaiellaceae bacterium]
MLSIHVLDAAAAKTVGAAFRRLGYTEDGIHRLLGEEAYSVDRIDAAVERRLPQSRLATLIRAFFLQQRVAVDELTRALGRKAVEALEATAIAELDGDEVVPLVKILAVEDLLVAADGDTSYAGDDPPDYVSAYTPTTRVADALTPRRRVDRALDVGTGSGAQALLAARHAKHVVATDVNARALAFTSLNAALNGLANIECRLGSMFEPVEGETFDLITCNAPYVVSPERRWVYRDSGLPADEASEHIVRSAGGQLADGGYATLVVSWLAGDEDAPDERPLAWVDACGCDAWILPKWSGDPLDHATRWNDYAADDPAAFQAALDEWTAYFEELGARWVTEGAILLHRRPDGRHSARVDDIDDDELDHAGAQIERAFEARELLAEIGDLGAARVSLDATLILERELEPRGARAEAVAATVELAEGTHPVLAASPRAAEVVEALDGDSSLGEVVNRCAARMGLSESQTARLRAEVLELVRELLELGALRLHA